MEDAKTSYELKGRIIFEIRQAKKELENKITSMVNEFEIENSIEINTIEWIKETIEIGNGRKHVVRAYAQINSPI